MTDRKNEEAGKAKADPRVKDHFDSVYAQQAAELDRIGYFKAPREMNDREKIAALIAACRAYHNALDMAFAELIEATRGVTKKPFMPSKSPSWPAMIEGKRVVDEIEAAL